jgi:hypothetical protein
VARPRPLPVSPSGKIASTVGDVRFAMLRTYMIEPRSLASRSFTTARDVREQVNVARRRERRLDHAAA